MNKEKHTNFMLFRFSASLLRSYPFLPEISIQYIVATNPMKEQRKISRSVIINVECRDKTVKFNFHAEHVFQMTLFS